MNIDYLKNWLDIKGNLCQKIIIKKPLVIKLSIEATILFGFTKLHITILSLEW